MTGFLLPMYGLFLKRQRQKMLRSYPTTAPGSLATLCVCVCAEGCLLNPSANMDLPSSTRPCPLHLCLVPPRPGGCHGARHTLVRGTMYRHARNKHQTRFRPLPPAPGVARTYDLAADAPPFRMENPRDARPSGPFQHRYVRAPKRAGTFCCCPAPSCLGVFGLRRSRPCPRERRARKVRPSLRARGLACPSVVGEEGRGA